MKTMIRSVLKSGALAVSFMSAQSFATDSVQGTYKAVLRHEATGFYQYALFTLSTVQAGGGTLKISANVRIVYGDWDSNEFLTYDFADVPMNILTRQISMRDPVNDVSFVGQLGDGEIKGDWYSSSVGRVGGFQALKNADPVPPANMQLVRSITGHYQGKYKNTNPQSNLPEKMALSLVTTQEMATGRPVLLISGNLRMYLGSFDSLEYYETPLKDVQFNFYNRYLTVKTQEYGLTLKGLLSLDGIFTGDVFADGLGKVGTIQLKAVQ